MRLDFCWGWQMVGSEWFREPSLDSYQSRLVVVMEIVKCFVVYSGPSINRTLYLLMAIFCKICVHITRLNLSFSGSYSVYIHADQREVFLIKWSLGIYQLFSVFHTKKAGFRWFILRWGQNLLGKPWIITRHNLLLLSQRTVWYSYRGSKEKDT